MLLPAGAYSSCVHSFIRHLLNIYSMPGRETNEAKRIRRRKAPLPGDPGLSEVASGCAVHLDSWGNSIWAGPREAKASWVQKEQEAHMGETQGGRRQAPLLAGARKSGK